MAWYRLNAWHGAGNNSQSKQTDCPRAHFLKLKSCQWLSNALNRASLNKGYLNLRTPTALRTGVRAIEARLGDGPDLDGVGACESFMGMITIRNEFPTDRDFGTGILDGVLDGVTAGSGDDTAGPDGASSRMSAASAASTSGEIYPSSVRACCSALSIS